MMYIHEQKNWPNFIWNNDELFDIITKVSFKQGKLLGKMQSLGFDFRQEALLNNLTEEITKSSEIEKYMNDFFAWANKNSDINPLIKAAISHLCFISIHPFEDGNGRIARSITELMLAKAEKSSYRFYSISAQIQKQKNGYYKILENTQKRTLDITNWITWFSKTMLLALETSATMIAKTIVKAKNLIEFNKFPLDENQKKMINMLFGGFEGNLTSSKWANICKCSQDTASRSIKQLIEYGILKQQSSGRSTHYILTYGE